MGRSQNGGLISGKIPEMDEHEQHGWLIQWKISSMHDDRGDPYDETETYGLQMTSAGNFGI